MSGFKLHPEAYDDIDEIRAHIAEDNPIAADRLVNEISDRLRLLPQFPNQGFRRSTFTSLPLRFVMVREYLIAYAPETNPCGFWPSCTDGAVRALLPPFLEDASRSLSNRSLTKQIWASKMVS